MRGYFGQRWLLGVAYANRGGTPARLMLRTGL